MLSLFPISYTLDFVLVSMSLICKWAQLLLQDILNICVSKFLLYLLYHLIKYISCLCYLCMKLFSLFPLFYCENLFNFCLTLIIFCSFWIKFLALRERAVGKSENFEGHNLPPPPLGWDLLMHFYRFLLLLNQVSYSNWILFKRVVRKSENLEGYNFSLIEIYALHHTCLLEGLHS